MAVLTSALRFSLVRRMSTKNKRRLSIGKGALLPMSAYDQENDQENASSNEQFLAELANDDQKEKKARYACSLNTGALH